MLATDESLGPGRYTLITQRGENANIKFWSDDDPVLPYIETVPIMLLKASKFLNGFCFKSFGRTTGTGAYAVWMLLSCYPDVDRDENVKAVLQILSLQHTHDEEAVGEVVNTYERLCEMVAAF
jgi:hypothetical protein